MTILKIRIRRNTSSGWLSTNPILDIGEQALDINTGSYRIGDGRTRWLQLREYMSKESMLDAITDAVSDALDDAVSATVFDYNAAQQALTNHIHSETPHPVYDEDDGPSFELLYQNAKV